MRLGLKVNRIKLHRKAFRELRKSAKVTADLRDRAEAVARTAGDGWVVREAPARNRARFVVLPTTPEAARESITDQAGVRALNAARG